MQFEMDTQKHTLDLTYMDKCNFFVECVNCRQTMFSITVTQLQSFSLWPCGAIWWQRSGSKLAPVMASCLTAASHYLNQCWIVISEPLWHSLAGNFTVNAQYTYPMCLKIINLRLQLLLPGANGLNCKPQPMYNNISPEQTWFLCCKGLLIDRAEWVNSLWRNHFSVR